MAQQQQLKDREKNLRKWVQLVKVVREDAVQVVFFFLFFSRGSFFLARI